MDPVWLVSLAGTVCVATVALIVVLLALVVRRRDRQVPVFTAREVTDAVTAAAAQHEVGAHADGVWEGTVRGRRVRWSLREVERETGSQLQLAMGTPVRTGGLGLTHRTMTYGAEPPELDLPECRVGDASFDVRFFVHADLEHLSMLSPPVRSALLAAAGDGELRLRSGWLWIDQIATPALAAAAGARMEAMFAAARAIDEIPDEVEQRVRWLSQDPVARVRANTLDLLLARGASDFTSWIARPLLSDLDVGVRSRAAEVLGDGERLLELVSDEKVPIELRARAGLSLDQAGGPAERSAAVEILARGTSALQEVAIALCQSMGEPSETVVMDLVGSPDGRIARKAVALLGRIGTARSLGVLQAVLESPDRPLLRVEAHAALEAMRSRSVSGRRAMRSTPPAEHRSHGPGDQRSLTPHPRGRVSSQERTRRLPTPER